MKLFFKSALTAIAAFTLAVSAAEKHFPYMHGCVDSDAAKIDIRTLLGVEQMNAVDTEAKIVSGDIKVNSAVVRLEGKNYQMNLNGIVLPVDTIQNLAGDTVRFFIWMKGENIGAKGFHWTGAPAVGITLYDDYGNVVTRSESEFKTRGTFPWHCYYVDITLPRTISLTNEAYNEAVKPVSDDAAMIKELLGSNSTGRNKPGLYITLTNFGGGKVWFGGISYTKIGKAGEHAANWKDKTYGTMAPNPEYDELPVIMFNGLSAENQWNFLNGNKAFGSIKTIAGLTRYLNENGDDWFHQQKAIAKLPYLFVTARELNLGSGFEDKWMNTLKEYLVSKQDEETGLWKSNGVPNILSSAAIAVGCFSPRSQRRSDSEMIPTPWSALAN
ncbi:MAG: hypothetical protein J6S21_02775, partial [Victivallales bacterium]|nr:hypothetical protein [Victivallales bacterium]